MGRVWVYGDYFRNMRGFPSDFSGYLKIMAVLSRILEKRVANYK